MILLYLIFTAAMLAPVYLLWQIAQAHERRIKALEAKREQERRVVAPVQHVQERPIEQPKAGTVAATAQRQRVFLSQTAHKAIALDNGGLEWEPKM